MEWIVKVAGAVIRELRRSAVIQQSDKPLVQNFIQTIVSQRARSFEILGEVPERGANVFRFSEVVKNRVGTETFDHHSSDFNIIKRIIDIRT
jgi:hypothetical protein